MNSDTYYQKTLGGWLGKNIGGTLGGPWEGQTCPLLLYFYDPVPKEPMPNDDFELQLVWLDMLLKKGIFIRPSDFVEYWLYRTKYNIAEYYMGRRNMSLGLLPPVTGSFNNWWIRGMGATIRSEIWGMLAPGMPDIAAAYAYMDATTDHAEDGVYGEMFFAAMESAAYTENDPHRLVETGLSYLPEKCLVRDSVNLVCDELKKGTPWRSIRHLICAHFAHPTDFTFVPVNTAFAVLGLLSADTFSECLCNAVNCGYDTDCTGATLGAVLGIMCGADAIPDAWLEPIGMQVVVTNCIPDIEKPDDIRQVTERVCDLGHQILEQADTVRDHLHRWTGLPFLSPSYHQPVSMPSSSAMVLGCADGLCLSVEYNGYPTIGRGESKGITLGVQSDSSAHDVDVTCSANPDWVLVLEDSQGSSVSMACMVEQGSKKAIQLTITAPEEGLQQTQNIHICVSNEKGATIEASIPLLGKSDWILSEPIAMDNHGWCKSIEEAGSLESSDATIRHTSHSTDDLCSFIPPEGYVVYAQTNLYSPEDAYVRLLANNTGPIRVFLNGEKVIDKQHWLAGIMPSWHLQGDGTHLLPKRAGLADVSLKKGWNCVLFRLEGHQKTQDATFHVTRINAETPDKAEWLDYVLPLGIHNVGIP